jgi:hypothetical protein
MIPDTAPRPSSRRGRGGLARGLLTTVLLLAVPVIAVGFFWGKTFAQEGDPAVMAGVDSTLGGSLLGLRPNPNGGGANVTRGRVSSPSPDEDAEVLLDEWVNTSSPRGPLP